MKAWLQSVFLCLAAFLLLGSSAARAAGNSPNALLAELKQAAADQDLEALFRLYSPRLMILYAIYFPDELHLLFSAQGSGNPGDFGDFGNLDHLEADARLILQVGELMDRYAFEAPFDRYRDPPTRAEAEALCQKVNCLGYVVELTRLLSANAEWGHLDDALLEYAGEIGSLHVDGEHAVAKIGLRSVEMVRIGGRWYLGTRTYMEPSYGFHYSSPIP